MVVWSHSKFVSGIAVKVAFFDGGALAEERDVVRRTLGFFPSSQARLLFSEIDRRNYRLNRVLVAQPDAVFALGTGHINLEYKSRSGRDISQTDWPAEVRLEHMLQCIFCGIVLAQALSTPVANILRYHNAALLLVPAPSVIRESWSLLPMAIRYYGGDDVSASQLARFVSDRVRSRFGRPHDIRSDEGRRAHERMFRK